MDKIQKHADVVAYCLNTGHRHRVRKHAYRAREYRILSIFSVLKKLQFIKRR